MKNALRTALAAAVAATALAVAVPPASAASASASAQPPVPACRATKSAAAAPGVAANPSQVQAWEYNMARNVLAKAGSMNAAKSHPIHAGSVPVRYGTQLLACSRDEFRHKDRDKPDAKWSGMTYHHWRAIHEAAKWMDITRW
ncbi:hypothetical protein [Streptomyces decoyicus]